MPDNTEIKNQVKIYVQKMKLIEIDPEVCGDKPVIRGTRISVKLTLELLSNKWSKRI